MDVGKVTAVSLLDLFTGFDTIDKLSSWEDLMNGLELLGRHSIGLNRVWLEVAGG